MPPRRAYQDPQTHTKLLDGLRRGMSRADAANSIGTKATTFGYWLRDDPTLRIEVESAERAWRERDQPSAEPSAWMAVAAAREPAPQPKSRSVADLLPTLGFYEFLTEPEWCSLEVSPAVRAIVLAAEARADEIRDEPLCVTLFGCPSAELPRERPRVVAVRSGGQCGKTSRLGAPKAVHAALTVPLPNVRPGQWARSLITAPTEDLAQAAIDYCRGIVWNSPLMRALLVDDVPEDADEEDVGTRTRIGLKRPDGRLVEIRIKAANSGGMGARSRSLVNALLDEVCFFRGADSKVNDTELYRAAVQRVVPGGQVWLTSTPWIEGFGKLEDFVANDWGKHGAALVALASTRLMFPGWDPDKVIESQMRREDPENAAREIDGQPLAAGEAAYYSPAVIRAAEAKPASAARVVAKAAAGDFAFVRNSSALVIAEAYEDGTFAVTRLEEHKPRQGRALRPSLVCHEFAGIVLEEGLGLVVCDGHYRESVREGFGKRRARCPSCSAWVEAPRKGPWTCEFDEQHRTDLGSGCGNVWVPESPRGIAVVPGPEGALASMPFRVAREGLNEGLVRLPAHPRLAAQLRAVEGRPRPGPGQEYQIRQPEQRNAGPGGTMAHGDLVSAMVLALWRVGLGRERPDQRRAAFGTLPESRGL